MSRQCFWSKSNTTWKICLSLKPCCKILHIQVSLANNRYPKLRKTTLPVIRKEPWGLVSNGLLKAKKKLLAGCKTTIQPTTKHSKHPHVLYTAKWERATQLAFWIKAEKIHCVPNRKSTSCKRYSRIFNHTFQPFPKNSLRALLKDRSKRISLFKAK